MEIMYNIGNRECNVSIFNGGKNKWEKKRE
jgi:hypothetical protein